MNEPTNRANRPTAPSDGEPNAADALYEAAAESLRAPSVANTQPWRWRVVPEAAELYADRERQLQSIDPAGRLLTVSCGTALHHARVMLAVQGLEPDVRRVPDPSRPDLLARITVGGPHDVDPADRQAHHAIRTRRTDRRPFRADRPLPAAVVETLCAEAAREGTVAHVIDPKQLRFLSFAARAAAQIEAHTPEAREEFADWTNRVAAVGDTPGDGVPPELAVPPVDRPVPMRDFAPGGHPRLDPGVGDDSHAVYIAISTDTDEPDDWLRAGEASSAVLLAATTVGLASSTLSEVVEVPGARALLRSLAGKTGHPQLVLRVGENLLTEPLPQVARRSPAEAIDSSAL